MAIEILMPAYSPGMTEGGIVKWLKKEGERVEIGSSIAEIETDKTSMDLESEEEGILVKILVSEGTRGIKVRTPIAILLTEEEAKNGLDASILNKKTLEKQTSNKVEDKGKESLSVAGAITSSSCGGSEDSNSNTNTKTVSITVREALRDAMAEEMRRDPDVFIIGEEVAEYQGAYKITQGLLQEFGARRVIDSPITEHGFAGLATGAAMAGLRPIVEFMTFNFAMQAIDHIVNSAGKTLYMSGGQMNVPIVFRGPNGAASRTAAQHSQCYAAWYGHIPGLKVIMPYIASDAKGLLKSAIRDPNPVVFLENEILYGHSFEIGNQDNELVPIGKARIHKSGSSATLVSFGIGMTYCIKAEQELRKEGLDIELIDLRTIRPIDLEAIIESVKKTNRLVIVEEGFPQFSVGDFIANQVSQAIFDYLDAPIITIAGKDVPMPYAANLEKLALPSVAEIISAIKTVSYL